MEPSPTAAFDATFAAIQAATDLKSEEICLAHMWEYFLRTSRADSRPSRALRDSEIDAVLRVMGNESNARYDDSEGFNTRVQCGHPDGLIALPTTPIFTGIALPLFDHNHNHTGLLLLNPPPVLVSTNDCASKYRDTHPDRLHANLEHAWIADPKLLAMQHLHVPPFDDVIINPHDRAVKEGAELALQHLKRSFANGAPRPTGDFGYPEICANAKLEHIGGIVAHVHHGELALPSDSWADRLAANPTLAPLLADAILDYERVAAAMKRHGITRQPTIMIYQHHARDPAQQQLHFPPTRENIALVERAMRGDRRPAMSRSGSNREPGIGR